MTMQTLEGPSPKAVEVFAALRRSKNVLITGPPGTGKTRLLNELARWFEEAPGVGFDPLSKAPFPPSGGSAWLPSPERTSRKSFRMTFHAGTGYRHLLRGLEPVPNSSGSFRFSRGRLFEANEHSRQPHGAALLIIDELNRGPAVDLFGDAIVALEADKRLDEQDEICAESYPIILPDDDGIENAYYLSGHLYIVAALNAADASVAPMDVAFLRRWEPFGLLPDVEVARAALGLNEGGTSSSTAQELLEKLVRAWEQVNHRVSLLRGSEYQLGHGVMIPEPTRNLSNVENAVSFVRERWAKIEQHVGELFFGENQAQVAVLGGENENVYRVEEGYLRAEMTTRIVHPNPDYSGGMGENVGGRGTGQ